MGLRGPTTWRQRRTSAPRLVVPAEGDASIVVLRPHKRGGQKGLLTISGGAAEVGLRRTVFCSFVCCVVVAATYPGTCPQPAPRHTRDFRDPPATHPATTQPASSWGAPPVLSTAGRRYAWLGLGAGLGRRGRTNWPGAGVGALRRKQEAKRGTGHQILVPGAVVPGRVWVDF